MSATQSGSPFRIQTDASVAAAWRLVKMSGAGAQVILNTATSTDIPIGVVQPAESYASGAYVAVKDFKQGGTHKVTAAGAITAGVAIYAAAAGKVQALPGGAGTYRYLGWSLQAATADGDIIEVWLDTSGATETVSGS